VDIGKRTMTPQEEQIKALKNECEELRQKVKALEAHRDRLRWRVGDMEEMLRDVAAGLSSTANALAEKVMPD